MFRSSQLVLVNKIDLLAHVDFDMEQCREDLRQVQPNACVMLVSARRGDGLGAWFEWLAQQLEHAATAATRLDAVR